MSGELVNPAACPRVSVILPVYNGARYLQAAIDSILAQTFRDFELIAIDDGSTDATPVMLDAIHDPRMRVVHQTNHGLALTLNRGIALARGEYVARQDADDISLPARFARQVEFLDANPGCAIVGSWSRILEDEHETDRGHQHPCENGELQMRLLFDSFFVHSSVMLRRAALDVVGPYPTDPARNPPEDFDLWSRLARQFSVANLGEVLQLYREVPGSITRTKAELLQTRAVGIAAENLAYVVGSRVAPAAIRDVAAVMQHADRLLSERPDWRAMRRAIELAGGHFAERFPQETIAISRAEQALQQQLKNVRLRRLGDGRLMGVARRVRNLFR